MLERRWFNMVDINNLQLLKLRQIADILWELGYKAESSWIHELCRKLTEDDK